MRQHEKRLNVIETVEMFMTAVFKIGVKQDGKHEYLVKLLEPSVFCLAETTPVRNAAF